ncbi:NmrA-like family protein [Apiospora arundinis]|uniref:NmrA-like family protein n=1 Tax=Apiospora arundinis TaxID=335852 RepID=A0ABR2J4G5_9PEZI
MSSTYLITQATGGQSGWVITHLLAAGAKVHAMVRNLNKELPAVLREPGVTLFEGDSTNSDAIYQAARGCQGVFLNTVPYPPGLEVQQAKTVLEAARKAGVATVVSSSTIGTDEAALRASDAVRDCGLAGYYASKHEAEELVRAAGFEAYTIVRPAVIHYDLCTARHLDNTPRLGSHGELDDLLLPGKKVPFTDCSDIGKYVAAALLAEPDGKFANQEIDMCNELFDFDEVAALLNKVAGKKDVKAVKRTVEELKAKDAFVFGQAFHLLANMYDFSSHGGAAAAGVQDKFGIPFTSLEAALTRDKASLLETLKNVN